MPADSFNGSVFSDYYWAVAHATRSAEGGKDSCGDRCDDLQRPLECFFLGHGVKVLMVDTGEGAAGPLAVV